MKKNDNVSITEKELLLELEYILVNHRYKCSSIESINASNSTYMYRIKKALHKSTVEEKRLAVLKSMISSVQNKIDSGMLFKEIFEPLPAIIVDELQNYSKNKSQEVKTTEEVSIEELKRKKALAKATFLNDIIDQIIPKLEGFTKKQLQRMESDYNEYIKINTSRYEITKANVEILGELNTGFIETTRKNLETTLYNDYGVKLTSKDKLSDKMSIDLLKYKVAALIYTNVMCNKRIVKIRPNLNNKINMKAYIGLKEDVHFLGKTVRERYIDEYGISPKDELIENYIGGQYTFEGLLEKRDAVIRKRNFK